MGSQRSEQADAEGVGATSGVSRPLSPREFPVREYIGAMALELAQMARWDGDEALGRLLDSAGAMASETLPRPVVPTQRSAHPARPS